MTKAETRKIVGKITALKKRIAKDRDDLRNLLDELNGIEECCERAVDDLERAADALSEYL